MKRLLSLLLSLLLAAVLLPCCPALAEETPQDRILHDFLAVLYYADMRLTEEDRALEAILHFTQTREWDDYLRACIAADLAADLVQYCAEQEIPVTATLEDYRAAAALGLDVQDIRLDVHTYNTSTRQEIREIILPIWRNIFVMELIELAHLESTLQGLAVKADQRLRSNAVLRRQYFLKANHLLRELGLEQADFFWSAMQTLAPQIAAAYPALYDDDAALMTELHTTATLQSELNLELRAILAMDAETLQEMQNMPLPDQEPAVIRHLPGMLPQPYLREGTALDMGYYWLDENGAFIFPQRGMDLSTPPMGLTMTLRNVTAEDYDLTVQAWYDADCTPLLLDEALSAFALADGTEVIISYYESEGRILISTRGGTVFFPPEWYIEAVTVTP